MRLYNDVFRGKKVLITGNTGFKGSWLSLWLMQMGAKVTGISHQKKITNPSFFSELNIDRTTQFIQADINDFEKLKKIIVKTQPDFIFHLAAQAIVSTSYIKTLHTFETNIIGTANVLEALKYLFKPCVVILATSDKCYDNKEWIWGYRENDALGGKDPYSASKGAADIIIQSYYHSFFFGESSKVRLAIVRAGNVIGGGDFADNRIIPDCYRAWSKNKPVTIRSPLSIRPWQHVLEPLSGYLRTAQLLKENKIANGEAYNFGPFLDQCYSVIDLVTAFANEYGVTPSKKYIQIQKEKKLKESHILKLNWDKAYYELDWRPILNQEQTIKKVADWYRLYSNKKVENLHAASLEQIKDYVHLAADQKAKWTD
jgi:CDP-glucose 4,6-dehydratase